MSWVFLNMFDVLLNVFEPSLIKFLILFFKPSEVPGRFFFPWSLAIV